MKRLALCLLCVCAVHLPVAAHVLDQYLQVAQIALASDGARVELRLIPGAQVAGRIIALIDVNGDGQISQAEEQAYAQRVLQDIALEVDGRRALLVLVGVQFPSQFELNEGNGAIRLNLAAEATLGAAGEHQLSFRNDHLPELGVYLANALVPATNEIKISGQERDTLQQELRINFRATPADARAGLGWAIPLSFGLCLALLFLFSQFRRRNAGKAKRIAVRRIIPLPPFFCLIALFVCLSPPALAHQQPTTLIVLDVAPDKVTMKLHIPLTELELAFGNEVSVNPEATLQRWQPQFKDYLLNHIHPTTGGNPWSVAVIDMQVQKAEQTQSGQFQEILVHLLLTPPAGASTRKFTLNYDVILHQVVTHKALVSIHKDWERGQTAEQQVGVISVNTETTRIEPLEINLEKGSLWNGFKGMVSLGMQHIKEGTDHLLFLLALLLPATLLVSGRRWGAFGGSRYGIVRLLKIVTAFTVGHSVTLLAGALGWVRLPQQPVEVLIAFSILVSAVHAIRPLFPGKEAYIAAGFGLVHGLAFATVLADLNLSDGPLALSIFGFNLGIELMQIFVIAVTVPWLILLSLTPVYAWVRIVSAALAAIASLGWIASRVSGESNFIDRSMQTVTQYAPLGILLLALLALPAYLYYSAKRRTEPNQNTSAHELTE